MILQRTINLATRIKFLFLPAYHYAAPKKDQHQFDLLYGINPVEAALHSNKRKFIQLLVSDSDRIELSSRTAKLIHLAKSMNLEIAFAPKEKLSRIVDHQPHQNIVLKCSPIDLENWNEAE